MRIPLYILNLVERHSLRLVVRNGARNATPAIRTVRTSKPRGRADCAFILHEIGHCIGKRAKYRLDEELRAWQNAHRFSRSWGNKENIRMAECLLSYEEWADNRFHRSTAWKNAILKAREIVKI